LAGPPGGVPLWHSQLSLGPLSLLIAGKQGPTAMQIAYLILCHTQPAQMGRLVAALPRTSPIFIHVDARTPRADYDAIVAQTAGHPLVRFVRRHRCFWSGYGIVRATNTLIAAAVASGIPFDRATLLSGTDYPIKPEDEIAAFFAAAGAREFIETFPLHAPNRWSNHGGSYHGPARVDWFHLRFRSRAWRMPWWRRLPYGYVAFGGSQWWTLTRAALEHIDRVRVRQPRLRRFFRNVFLPDESYVQTVLGNSSLAANIVSDDLRLHIWDRPEPPYPAVLKTADFALLQASDRLFARKFDLRNHPEVYDRIDGHLRA